MRPVPPTPLVRDLLAGRLVHQTTPAAADPAVVGACMPGTASSTPPRPDARLTTPARC